MAVRLIVFSSFCGGKSGSYPQHSACPQQCLLGIDASEFPEVMTASKLEGQSTRIITPLRPLTLRKVIQQVAFAAASEETHPFLSGAFTSLEGDRLTLAATDGYCLSVRNVTLPQPVEESLEVIVPARALTELARIATEASCFIVSFVF